MEVRVADVCLDAGTAVLLAGLTRALVATALAEARRGTPVPAAPARQVAAGLAAAARHGLAGAGVDPFTGQAAGARSLLSRLLDHVRPALSDHGDTQIITRLLRRLDDRGTGAGRQRALFTSAASTPAFITALARATLSCHEPAASGLMPGSRQRPGAPPVAALRESIPAAAAAFSPAPLSRLRPGRLPGWLRRRRGGLLVGLRRRRLLHRFLSRRRLLRGRRDRPGQRGQARDRVVSAEVVADGGVGGPVVVPPLTVRQVPEPAGSPGTVNQALAAVTLMYSRAGTPDGVTPGPAGPLSPLAVRLLLTGRDVQLGER